MPERAMLHAIVTSPQPRPTARKAQLADVDGMFRLINHYAEKHRMLSKTKLQLYENMRDYSVVMEGSNPGNILGCGALHLYWDDLAEIRALAVAPEMIRKGVGSQLMDVLLDEARNLQIARVFSFTYEPEFFGRFGFLPVEHRTLPLKVYNECFHCSKFHKCDEIAMVLQL